MPNADFKHTIIFSSQKISQNAYLCAADGAGGRGRSGNVKVYNSQSIYTIGGGSPGNKAVELADATKLRAVSVYDTKTTLIMDLHNNGENSILLNGQQVANPDIRTTITSSLPIYFFSLSGGGMSGYYRLYYDKIEQNGAIVHEFIAVRRDRDGVIGMYDTVTNTFKTNAGSGTFIAGPEIPKIATTSYVAGMYAAIDTTTQNKLTSTNVVTVGPSNGFVKSISANNGVVTVTKSDFSVPFGSADSATRVSLWFE